MLLSLPSWCQHVYKGLLHAQMSFIVSKIRFLSHSQIIKLTKVCFTVQKVLQMQLKNNCVWNSEILGCSCWLCLYVQMWNKWNVCWPPSLCPIQAHHSNNTIKNVHCRYIIDIYEGNSFSLRTMGHSLCVCVCV